MKYVIFLASNDSDALNNYRRLTEFRVYGLSVENPPISTRLEYDKNLNVFIVLKKELLNFLRHPTVSTKTIEIEFIAHGHPYHSGKILVQPKLSSQDTSASEANTMIEVTPAILADFFNQFRDPTGNYNFNKLTLYCCSSLKFGQELSEKMPGMEIICFNQNISINEDGDAYPYSDNQNERGKAIDRYGNVVEKYSAQHERAIPYLAITNNNFTKVVSLPPELNNKSTPTSTGTAKSPTTETLSASKPIIRGDTYRHYRSKSFSSYLPREKKSASSPEPTDNTESHKSLPTTPRRR